MTEDPAVTEHGLAPGVHLVGGAAEQGAELTITLDRETVTLRHRLGMTLLQAARFAGLQPPSSCEAGNCATCMARVVRGRTVMRVNDVLTDEETAEGWVLTCQATPASDAVTVVYA